MISVQMGTQRVSDEPVAGLTVPAHDGIPLPQHGSGILERFKGEHQVHEASVIASLGNSRAILGSPDPGSYEMASFRPLLS